LVPIGWQIYSLRCFNTHFVDLFDIRIASIIPHFGASEKPFAGKNNVLKILKIAVITAIA